MTTLNFHDMDYAMRQVQWQKEISALTTLPQNSPKQF